MIRTRIHLVASLALGVCLFLSGLAGAQTDPLPSWNDGPAKQGIVKFVQAATDSSSPQHVPPAARIAVFDNDGTLWSEQPLYFQGFFAFDRVKALAPKHPEWKTQQPFKGILENDMKAVAAAGEKGLAEVIGATHSGMTTDEFAQIVKDWVAQAQHPRFKRPYTDLVYQPMLELLTYLRANGFKTFIVSGGGADFMRVFAEEVYGIPPEQVVGSVGETKLEMRNGKPALLKLPKINLVDDKAGKPVGIHRFIGRRPVLAFGNSDGDQQMLEWAAAGDGLRFMGLVHTDGEREWAPTGSLDRAPGQGAGRGDAEGLDGRRYEAGLEGDLPVPEVRGVVGARWAPRRRQNHENRRRPGMETAMNGKKTLGITGLALAGLIVAGTGSEIRAQVAGSTTMGVTVEEMKVVALGWSAKKKIMGKAVYNDKNEKIGTVDDLIITPDKSVSYAIIGAGGFLGMGKHDVAIPVSQFKEDKGRIVLAGATKDALKAMPKFEYAK